MNPDFFSLMRLTEILDRLFRVCTPAFAACVLLAAIYVVFYRG